MKQKATALISISLLLITFFAIPVSAFYFDFQYFETDKMVYEVGETIDMVAKLIADFSDEGWCYVSFAVVTDLGPSFADEYFISPSPDARYLNSSYTILPEHTSPTETGIQAFVLFTVEIFDTVSQSAGDNIQVTINRGHLTIIPLSSLSVQYGLNTTLTFKFASIHNDNITYSSESINVQVEDPSSQNVLDVNTTTNAEGLMYLNWSDVLGLPGLYNMTVSSDGNEDFLPFVDSFQITVLPTSSNLTVISSPSSVYCQSPDGNQIKHAELIVEHSDLGSNPIDNSTVQWTTNFGSGIMTGSGGGEYSTMIPFNTSPGFYYLNITARNPQYQTAITTTIVNVLANPLLFSTSQSHWNVTRGENVTIDVLIESAMDWNQSIQLRLIDETMQLSLTADVQPNQSNLITIPIWHNISVGQHIINISPMTEYYQFTVSPSLTLTIFGILDANISTEITYYREFLEFNLDALDDNNQAVFLVDISIFCDNTAIPFALTGLVNSSATQIVSLPMWITPGLHNITFTIRSQYFQSSNQSISLRVWMRTNISIVITMSDSESDHHNQLENTYQGLSITRRISCGSIISPPPILVIGTMSTSPFTARLTSLDN